VQEYFGAELGLEDKNKVFKVYRSEDEVFSVESLKTFANRPVTIDHPPTFVDAKNWKEFSVGATGTEVMRDGEFIRVPLIVLDAKAISHINSDKKEISMGYSADLIFEEGVTDSGEKFDAYQKNIRINHLALVDVARGGPELKVYDSVKKEVLKMSDKALEILQQNALDAKNKILEIEKKLKDADMSVEELQAVVSKKDEEIAVLKAQLETMKAKMAETETPEAVDKAVAERAAVVDAAKNIFSGVVTTSKSNTEIKKQCVEYKIGDTAKNWNAEQIAASFEVLKVSTNTPNAQKSVSHADSFSAWEERKSELANAWKK
jgi:hypothetical protein